MDFLTFPIATMLAGAFLTLFDFVLLLNIFGLPVNWLLLGLIVLWKLAHPATNGMDTWFWIMMVALALTGEALEFGMQVIRARKYGSSSSGAFTGMIGAIVGSILLTPLFFGLGALIGAWTGCFLTELIIGQRPVSESLIAAFVAMVGRFLGTTCKCGVGGYMLALTATRIWPDFPPQFPTHLVPDPSDSIEDPALVLQDICALFFC
ncbi:MAG: DUF456 domain-containing protein [Desulfovibrio sp.]|jgi:uncharacterized protein YqgC (DUF456 family)|nr:DUF456 domain-containing protein [Desulfovibrio sp.]